MPLPASEVASPETVKRILFVNRFFYPDHSATSQILGDLAFALAADGSDVSVITSRLLYEDATATLPGHEVVRGVRICRVWSSRFGRRNLVARAVDYVTFYLGAAWAVWRLANPGTVLVAKTDPPLISMVIAPIAVMRKAHLVNWLQDVFPEVANALQMRLVRGPVLSLLRLGRNASLQAARTNVVLGHRMESVIRGQGIPSSRVKIIPNWADGEDIQPVSREDNALRSEWNLSGKFVVGYSGNLGRAHEFETILNAAECLLRTRPDVTFLFIGGGAQKAALEREVTRRSLANVHFRPYQARERLGESLSVADVHLVSLNPALEGLVVPSKFYGIAAAGRPTLFVGDIDGEIARVLRTNECGYGVATGDHAGLTSAITRLASDPALCSLLGRNARAVFERSYDRRLALVQWKQVLSGK